MASAPTAILSRHCRLVLVGLRGVLLGRRARRVSAAAPAPVTGFVLPVARPAGGAEPVPCARHPLRSRATAASTWPPPRVRRCAPQGPAWWCSPDELAGRGVVSIEHEGGLRTTYEPVTATVRAGRDVTAGELIGVLQPGHPGCAPAVMPALGRSPARPALSGPDVAAGIVAGSVAALGRPLMARRHGSRRRSAAEPGVFAQPAHISCRATGPILGAVAAYAVSGSEIYIDRHRLPG